MGGRTRRLAIFRVHSVAKPQLTALLGSYSSSRPLASSLPRAALLFRFLFSSHFYSSASRPQRSVFVVPPVSPLVRPPLVLLFLACEPPFFLPRSLPPHCISHTRSLALSSVTLEFVRFLLLYSRFLGTYSRALVCPLASAFVIEGVSGVFSNSTITISGEDILEKYYARVYYFQR